MPFFYFLLLFPSIHRLNLAVATASGALRTAAVALTSPIFLNLTSNNENNCRQKNPDNNNIRHICHIFHPP